mgnify:CR=1 FL=1
MSHRRVALRSVKAPSCVLASIEDAWVPAFVMEEHRSGLLTVFVPSVPTAAAGSIYLLPEDRVRRLDVPVTSMLSVICGWVLACGVMVTLSVPDGVPPVVDAAAPDSAPDAVAIVAVFSVAPAPENVAAEL